MSLGELGLRLIVTRTDLLKRYKYGGEHPRAYVVKASPEVTAASLEAWVASRLASYKRLTGGVEFVDVVPKSASGKILRQILRDRASKGSLVEKPVSRL